MKKLIKVAIGIPDKGITDDKSYDNHLEFMHKLGQLQARTEILDGPVEYKFFLIVIARVFQALARERLAEIAIDDIKADYLLMWDDDMILPMDMFERLIAHDVDIIAPLAFTRLGPPYKPVIYNLKEGYDAVVKARYYINTIVHNYPRNQLVECDAVGFGAVLIKTSVIKKMQKPWFMTTSGAGEDIHFCHMARKQGFRVFCDTSVKLGHVGEPTIVTEELYDQDQDINKMRETHGEQVKYPKAV